MGGGGIYVAPLDLLCRGVGVAEGLVIFFELKPPIAAGWYSWVAFLFFRQDPWGLIAHPQRTPMAYP